MVLSILDGHIIVCLTFESNKNGVNHHTENRNKESLELDNEMRGPAQCIAF